MNLEVRLWPVGFKPPPLLDNSPFIFWFRRFEFLSLGCLWCFEILGLVLGRFLPFFCPPDPPAQCRARVRVKRRYLRRRTVAFSSLFNFALPTPSSAQSRGATVVPCSRVTGYRAMHGPVCHLFIIFVCCICSSFFLFFFG